MYCTYCGKQIADNAAFCVYCGKPTAGGDELATLVAAARRGSQDAVSALYEKTYSKVYYTVKSMIKDEDAVFDIVQDTYIKAFAHLDSFQGDEKFLPWVRQIGANTARNWLKKKRPLLFTELNAGEEQDTPVEELFPDERSENLPEQFIDQNETKRLLREIIEELPEDQRAVIGMFYYEELSVKEIAAAMAVSESAVKSRLMYGRNKIEKKVRELEKRGTKLYSLAPIPFLLLLFHNQKVYAAEAPNGWILQNIIASRSAGAAAAARALQGTAQGSGTAGAAAGTGAAGGATQSSGMAGTGAVQTSGAIGAMGTTAQGLGMAGAAAGIEAAGAGTAAFSAAAGTGTAGAVAGGLGALKIGLIAFGTAVVVGLGIFGVTQMTSRSNEFPEAPAFEDDIEEEDDEEAEELEESEAQEEEKKSSPLDEALEQYRIIIGQADSYEYETNIPDLELIGYQYALVQMHPDDPVPTLLLEKDEKDIETASFYGNVRIFQYDPNTKMVRQPTEMIERFTAGAGGARSGFSMAGDGEGIFYTDWMGGTGNSTISRITLDGDSLNREKYWSGQIFEEPDYITFIEIEWHEIEDLSALDNLTARKQEDAALSGQDDSSTLPTDGERIVLTGTVGTYDYDEIVELQKQPDPNAAYYDEASWELARSRAYRVILLDKPQILNLHDGDGEGGYSSGEALMISFGNIDGMEQYEGKHITFSIDPAHTLWPSDTSLPFLQPSTGDIHVLE